MKLLDLNSAVDLLRRHKTILVTGPQRSGTTIASKILAIELGLKWIPEEVIDVDKLDSFFRVHFSEANYVIQAPGLSFVCHLLPVDAVVFMWRADREIANSAMRIAWMKHNAYEAEKYFKLGGKLPSWRLKKHIYRTFQIGRIANAITLAYDSLEAHPLYVSPELRKTFHCRQIEIEQHPVGGV